MIEICLPLTSMVFDCILFKLPWSLIDIQLSIQYGDRKEQHPSDSFGQIVYMLVSSCLSCLMFDNCYHVVLTSSCFIHPLYESSFTLWNTNLVVECARYFEKSFHFWPEATVFHFICETQFIILALLLFLAYLIVYAGYMYMSLWIPYIAHGICFYLIISLLTSWWHNFWPDLSADASLLDVLWVSFILVQLLRIVIVWYCTISLLPFYFHSSMLHDGTSVADICQEALCFVWYGCCVSFWSMSHSI